MKPVTQLLERPIGLYGLDEDAETEGRLEFLLEANRRTQLKNESKQDVIDSMIRPIDSKRAFALFGLMIGTLGPLSIFVKLLSDAGGLRNNELLFPVLCLVATIATATVGYFTGKVVGNIIQKINAQRFSVAFQLYILTGLCWGAVSGFAGGIFLFLVGSIFGAFIGAAFGGAATLAFGLFHRYLSTDGVIERRHFLPLSFGTVLFLCSFILGL